MKKVLVVIVAIIMAITCTLLVACNKEEQTQKEYTIVAPDGATALALASLIKDGKVTENAKFKVEIVVSTEIAGAAVKNDFAIVPVNLASKIYKEDNSFRVVSTITNGNLFLMSSVNKENFNLEDLKGKMLYTIGQAAIPSMILFSLLNMSNIPYEISDTPIEGKVAIVYCQDGPTLLPNLVKAKQKGEEVYGMLAEPAVTNAINGGKAFEVLDIQEAYKNATNAEIKGFAQAVLICKQDLAQDNALISALLSALSKNAEKVVSDPASALDAINTTFETSLPKTLNATQVSRCNIKINRAKDNKEYIKQALDSIASINPKAVGEVPALNSPFYA